MESSGDYDPAVGDYKPGSITRVKLKNFLTYTDVDFSPGPRLNMVIGANGTGKSTILCALCLGLGGEPKLLGRADDARAFIMHERTVASICLTLAPHPGQEVHVLKRKIDRNKGSERGTGKGASTFYINDQKCSLKDVQKLVKETYNISIDNLCTFLPQDKVGSFSGFNQIDLLRETEKTLCGGEDVYNSHMQLIEAESDMLSGDHNVDTIQAKLDKLLVEKQRFEREKERMEEREKAEALVKLLKKKRMWEDYNLQQAEVIELHAEKKASKLRLRQAQAELEPLEEEKKEISARKKEIDAELKKLERHVHRFKDEMNKSEQKHEKFDDAIESTLADLHQIDAARSRKLESHAKAKERVEIIEANLRDVQCSPEQLDKEFSEASQEKKAAHRALSAARIESQALHQQTTQLEENIDRSSSKLSKLQDDKAQRRQEVARQWPQVEKILQWVDENRKLFRRPVYGPVVCEVTMKTHNAAAFLEAHVSNGLLKSFLVEDKADYDLLFDEMRRKRKLPISINLISGVKEIKRPYGDAKMEKLKRDYGVIGYLDESFQAPDTVMQALRSFGQVHRVLVGDDKTQAAIDEKGLLDFLSAPDTTLGQQGNQQSCIFASSGKRTKKYSQSVSRYSHEISSRIDDISPARILAPSNANPELKESLAQQLRDLHNRMNEMRPKLADAEKKKADLESQGQRISERTQRAKEAKENFVKMKNRLNNAIAKEKDAAKDLEEDDQSRKRELLQSIMTKVGESIVHLESHASSHEKLMEATYANAGVRIDRDAVAFKERKITDTLLDKQQAFKHLRDDAATIHSQFEKKKAALKKLRERNDKDAPLFDENNEALPLKEELENLEYDSLEDIDAALEEAEQKVNSIHNDPNAVRQYKENLAEIEKVEYQLEQVRGSKDAIDRRIQQLLTPWKRELETAIGRVNELFEKYMAEVQCTGEVRLKKGGESGNEDCDFKNWGCEIRVSFREGVKAQVLSAQVQSGGERSVSTIMYLMALQEMMVAPFRCVDEINQGLDERNERLVFRRIVENSCQPPTSSPIDHCGQYFLITPKLLPQLLDMEHPGVTVLIVMNGPYNFDKPTDFSVDELVKKRRNTISDEEGNDENNPNAAGKSKRTKKRRSN